MAEKGRCVACGKETDELKRNALNQLTCKDCGLFAVVMPSTNGA
jgi:DNA-directed RNA polymerase subunit RPC12/RpoP